MPGYFGKYAMVGSRNMTVLLSSKVRDINRVETWRGRAWSKYNQMVVVTCG
jgi:hypothetical protein